MQGRFIFNHLFLGLYRFRKKKPGLLFDSRNITCNVRFRLRKKLNIFLSRFGNKGEGVNVQKGAKVLDI